MKQGLKSARHVLVKQMMVLEMIKILVEICTVALYFTVVWKIFV